jgi:hypothetical protein
MSLVAVRLLVMVRGELDLRSFLELASFMLLSTGAALGQPMRRKHTFIGVRYRSIGMVSQI